MARSIIRYSMNGERSNEMGNQIRVVLQDAGFRRVGTASLEVWDADLFDAINGIGRRSSSSPGRRAVG